MRDPVSKVPLEPGGGRGGALAQPGFHFFGSSQSGVRRDCEMAHFPIMTHSLSRFYVTPFNLCVVVALKKEE